MSLLGSIVRRLVPARHHEALDRLVAWKDLRLKYWGWKRFCPLCRTHLRCFVPFGDPPRPEARCPMCLGLERHRLVWLYFRRATDLFARRPKRMLDVAPEPAISGRLKRIRHLQYVSVDLVRPTAMVRMSLTSIPFPADTFDVIYCSHVLEHVRDDRQAMRELSRVLKPGGWAILQVPLVGETTLEDPSVTSPEERRRLFGQHDHVRQYGRDYAERVGAAGFQVCVDPFVRTLPPKKQRYYGLDAGEDIYVCMKRNSARKNTGPRP